MEVDLFGQRRKIKFSNKLKIMSKLNKLGKKLRNLHKEDQPMLVFRDGKKYALSR